MEKYLLVENFIDEGKPLLLEKVLDEGEIFADEILP